jgi:cytochrome P450
MYQGRPAWVVSRYQDIRAALVDPRLSADTIPNSLMPTGPEEDGAVMFARIDDPEHHRLRRMMTRDFTFRRADGMRPQIQEIVDRYLDEMIGNGPPADLVRDFALPVPSLVINRVRRPPGQNLARVEMQTAFATLARRLPGLRLAVTPDELRLKGESGIYGMKELPVTW